jgi:hypothetical protein
MPNYRTEPREQPGINQQSINGGCGDLYSLAQRGETTPVKDVPHHNEKNTKMSHPIHLIQL